MAHITHKIRIYPNRSQTAWLRKACGISRWVYNWGLNEWKSQYDAYKLDNTKIKPSRFGLANQLNKLKVSEPNLKWLTETSDQPAQNALQDLDAAFKRFFNGTAKYPVFKKAKARRSFRQNVRNKIFIGGKLKLVNLKDPIRMAQQWRFAQNAKFILVTVSEKNGKWYAAITAEIPNYTLPAGIDLGITTLATTSDGQKLTKRKTASKDKEKLKRIQRRLSRKQKGSKNRLKAKAKLANLHEKIGNRREHDIQTITTALARQHQNIVMETLNIKGMMRNHRLAGALADACLYRFSSELERKVLIRGGTFKKVDRWFASSKLCSCCGLKNTNLKLSDRIWTCMGCGTTHDRDINAATNLKNAA